VGRRAHEDRRAEPQGGPAKTPKTTPSDVVSALRNPRPAAPVLAGKASETPCLAIATAAVLPTNYGSGPRTRANLQHGVEAALETGICGRIARRRVSDATACAEGSRRGAPGGRAQQFARPGLRRNADRWRAGRRTEFFPWTKAEVAAGRPRYRYLAGRSRRSKTEVRVTNDRGAGCAQPSGCLHWGRANAPAAQKIIRAQPAVIAGMMPSGALWFLHRAERRAA
jgi:hypothetical protein